MSDEEKKGKIEKGAEKTGEVVGKVGKAGWGVVKGLGHGLKKGLSKEEEKKGEEEKK
jgi:hypothetical protein